MITIRIPLHEGFITDHLNLGIKTPWPSIVTMTDPGKPDVSGFGPEKCVRPYALSYLQFKFPYPLRFPLLMYLHIRIGID
jgi:hypothetical protein